MGLRVCLVTPFAWSRPHDVNEHVEGLARELRALGHLVTVLAPSTRASDIVAGRRAREPCARAGAWPIRHRPRVRARAAEPLIPRPARLARAGRRHVPVG